MSSRLSIATPTLPDLAERVRVVGVVADLRRQVEGDREPGRALLEQVAVAPVRLGGGAEARVLPHRPEPPAVAGGVQPAREGVLAGLADRRGVAERTPGRTPARATRSEAVRKTRSSVAVLVMDGSPRTPRRRALLDTLPRGLS